MKDITTPEEMAARMRSGQVAPLPGEPVTGETRVINKAPEGIFETSQMLAANGKWTLVPKGAVLYVPPSMQTYVTTSPSGTLVPLQEFIAANRQWLTTEEISIEQAAGQEALKPDAQKNWTGVNKVVVATHQGGAVSCKLPAPAKP